MSAPNRRQRKEVLDLKRGEGVTTGWPPSELMQDDSRELSRWLSTQPDAGYLVRQNKALDDLIASSEELGLYEDEPGIEASEPLVVSSPHRSVE